MQEFCEVTNWYGMLYINIPIGKHRWTTLFLPGEEGKKFYKCTTSELKEILDAAYKKLPREKIRLVLTADNLTVLKLGDYQILLGYGRDCWKWWNSKIDEIRTKLDLVLEVSKLITVLYARTRMKRAAIDYEHAKNVEELIEVVEEELNKQAVGVVACL